MSIARAMEAMRRHRVSVRFRDLDALGHVNSSVYFSYMESARVAFSAALFGESPWYRVPFILGSARCEYRRPVEEPIDLDVVHWVSRLGESSWDLDYAIEDQAGERVAVGRTTQIWFDYDEGESVPIPSHQRDKLKGETAEALQLR